MIEKEFFKRPITIDITTATIGINREDWYCHKPGMTQQEVRETMLIEKFDVVPIVNKQGFFEKYFTLDEADNTKLKVNMIGTSDRLYYLTHVRDAILRMKTENRAHFFLSNGRDQNDIVGLLSLSNYNSREFYVFLFNLISYTERELADLIESNEIDAFKVLTKLSHTKELWEQLKTIRARFEQDRKNNNENDYKEYLYLHHLISLVKAEGKYQKLGYAKGQDFESGTGLLKDLRNKIAHPVKSLVRNLSELSNLDAALNKLYEFKERLEKLPALKTE